ncbi:hypothetical protein [Massilia sp. LC238]|uniref:hypothetical protein n=1 Tax=Massilia sp. LC238 TaxID=1502852 RepID=UPI0004E3808E|nr:hypothetical protein [Massilia sp. LC238]KFC70148.1 hypothetical protein FG94_02437 [Massilia sp. LC238]
MPRKSAAVPAAAKGAARAKAAPAKAVKPAAKPAAKAAKPAKPAAKPTVKVAAKAAAKSLAAPVAKRAARKAAAPAAVRQADTARPVLVRDSFTMPEQEYAVLAEVKQACLRAGIDVKKSELLRIGVALLGQVDIATLKAVLAALPQLKTGRPPASQPGLSAS